MRLMTYIILAILFSSCSTKHLAVVKINGKFGCINKKGKIVIKPEWDYILQGYKNNQILVERDSLYGYINNKGCILIKPQYPEAELFCEGFAAVNNGMKYGFINIKGDTVIPFIYDDVSFTGFSKGLCDVAISSKFDSCGYINKKGDVVIPFFYSTCYPFKNKYATVVTFKYEYLLIDKKGNTYNYDDVGDNIKFYPPRPAYPSSIKTSTGQGRVNKRGDTIVPPKYNVTGNLSDGMYIVKDRNDKWGAYDNKGTLKIALHFDDLSHFSNGLAVFMLNNKYGFINKRGKVVIKPIFEDLSHFSKGLAYAVINNKVGYINRKGDFVIKPTFEPFNLGHSFE